MTDYEPYVAEPAEPAPREQLARLRPLLAWMAALIVVAALAFVWVRNSGSEDPSLDVPADQLTDPAAPPADPAAPPVEGTPAPADPAADPASQPAP